MSGSHRSAIVLLPHSSWVGLSASEGGPYSALPPFDSSLDYWHQAKPAQPIATPLYFS